MTPRTLRLSDGKAVRALVAGKGEALVLIHGVGMRAEAWGRRLFARLGFRESEYGTWKAVSELVRAFRMHKEPRGIAAKEWAERSLAHTDR